MIFSNPSTKVRTTTDPVEVVYPLHTQFALRSSPNAARPGSSKRNPFMSYNKHSPTHRCEYSSFSRRTLSDSALSALSEQMIVPTSHECLNEMQTCVRAQRSPTAQRLLMKNVSVIAYITHAHPHVHVVATVAMLATHTQQTQTHVWCRCLFAVMKSYVLCSVLILPSRFGQIRLIHWFCLFISLPTLPHSHRTRNACSTQPQPSTTITITDVPARKARGCSTAASPSATTAVNARPARSD